MIASDIEKSVEAYNFIKCLVTITVRNLAYCCWKLSMFERVAYDGCKVENINKVADRFIGNSM